MAVYLRLSDDELMCVRWALEQYHKEHDGRLWTLSQYAGSANAREEARRVGSIVLTTRKLVKITRRMADERADAHRLIRRRTKKPREPFWRPTLERLEKEGLWRPYRERERE